MFSYFGEFSHPKRYYNEASGGVAVTNIVKAFSTNICKIGIYGKIGIYMNSRSQYKICFISLTNSKIF